MTELKMSTLLRVWADRAIRWGLLAMAVVWMSEAGVWDWLDAFFIVRGAHSFPIGMFAGAFLVWLVYRRP